MLRITLAYEQRIRIRARKSAANVLAQNLRGVPAFVTAVSLYSELSCPFLFARALPRRSRGGLVLPASMVHFAQSPVPSRHRS